MDDTEENLCVFRPGTMDTEVRRCDWTDCDAIGEHRAPKSKVQIRDYYWFCIKHVRIYNCSWNYYEGMSDEEVDNIIRSDTTWNRPTWPLGDLRAERVKKDSYPPFINEDIGLDFEKINDPFGFFAKENFKKQSADGNSTTSLSTKERKALLVLGFDTLVSAEELKGRYKLLVKRFHPDVTGGNKEAEERLKLINEAYKIIKTRLVVA